MDGSCTEGLQPAQNVWFDVLWFLDYIGVDKQDLKTMRMIGRYVGPPTIDTCRQ